MNYFFIGIRTSVKCLNNKIKIDRMLVAES